MNVAVHPAAKMRLASLTERPGGTILLYGPAGVGKRTAALEAARQLNCEGCSDGSCRSCRLVLGGNHPDVIVVLPDEKAKIGIEAVHELQRALTFERYGSHGQRVVVIARADTLTLPAQAALLKTLEEPAAATTVILTATTPTSLLPTVISRCRLIYLPPVPAELITALLTKRYPGSEVPAITALSQGLPGRALSLAADPAQLQSLRDATATVDELLGAASLYERLRLAAKLATLNRDTALATLATLIRSQAREHPQAAHQLPMIDRLHQRLAANVSPKVAYEALAVELS